MYSHILVPVAPDHTRDVAAAFEVARKLQSDGGTISAVTVQEHIPLMAESYVPAEVQQQVTAQVHENLEEQVPKDISQKTVLHGSPAHCILQHAREIGADCIVVASHRPGLGDYLIGSTAGRIVRHAPCAVHVIR